MWLGSEAGASGTSRVGRGVDCRDAELSEELASSFTRFGVWWRDWWGNRCNRAWACWKSLNRIEPRIRRLAPLGKGATETRRSTNSGQDLWTAWQLQLKKKEKKKKENKKG